MHTTRTLQSLKQKWRLFLRVLCNIHVLYNSLVEHLNNVLPQTFPAFILTLRQNIHIYLVREKNMKFFSFNFRVFVPLRYERYLASSERYFHVSFIQYFCFYEVFLSIYCLLVYFMKFSRKRRLNRNGFSTQLSQCFMSRRFL